MLIKHHAQGKIYLIACPERSRVVRPSDRIDSHCCSLHSTFVVPWGGREILIPDDPPELLPLLAESGRCGLSLVGEPRPDSWLVGVACPHCSEDDANWLVVEDSPERIHCDSCGADFDPGVAGRID